jgi:hypothetical protein
MLGSAVAELTDFSAWNDVVVSNHRSGFHCRASGPQTDSSLFAAARPRKIVVPFGIGTVLISLDVVEPMMD